VKKDTKKKRISASSLAVLADCDSDTVTRVFSAVAGALMDGKSVAIQGFGVFDARKMQGRGKFISPLTGAESFGKPWVKAGFKAAKGLKQLLSGEAAE
jgi:nucleoid DNA-binding protein